MKVVNISLGHMNRITLLALILLIPTLVLAGFSRGNGGHILVCEKNGEKTLTLLDIFEAQARYGFQLDFARHGDEFHRARIIIDRISKLSPNRHRQYVQWLQEFRQETAFLDDMSIVPIPDIGVSFIPKNCTLEQMIIQAEPLFETEKRYTIDRRLWDRMDLDNRAAAIVHELIYREANSKENRHQNSESSRILNGYIHSTRIKTATLKEWLILNQRLGFHQGEAHGIPVKLNSFVDSTFQAKMKTTLLFYDDHHLKQAEIPFLFKLNLLDRTYQTRCKDDLVTKYSGSTIRFFPDGKLEEVSFRKTKSCGGIELEIGELPYYIFSGIINRVIFNQEGEIAEVQYNISEAPPIMLMVLLINGPHIRIERHFSTFRHHTTYSVRFTKNKPSLLINEEFNPDKSKTLIRSANDWILAPNKAHQEIY